jgi:hypothetical protein
MRRRLRSSDSMYQELSTNDSLRLRSTTMGRRSYPAILRCGWRKYWGRAAEGEIVKQLTLLRCEQG